MKEVNFIQKEVSTNAMHLQADSDEEMPECDLEKFLES